MYSISRILKGIQNPNKAYHILKRDAARWLYPVINTGAYIQQRNKDSEYGLVVNKGRFVFDTWGPAMYPFLVKQYIKKFDPVVISSQRIYDQHKDELEYIFSLEPGFSAPKINYTNGQNQNIIMFTSDPNNKVDWFHTYTKENEIDYVVTPYYDPFQYYFPEFDEKRLVHFPWSVPREYVIDPDEVQFHGDEKITLFGNSGQPYYKDRDWCRQFSFVDDLDYSSINTVGSREEYYKWLRNFDSIIAAHSNAPQWQFLIGKFLEIPSGGALLFAQDVKDLRRAGFSNDNCVIFTRDNFEKKANEYLRNPSSYLDRRRRGVELIRSEHTTQKRIETITNLFSQK